MIEPTDYLTVPPAQQIERFDETLANLGTCGQSPTCPSLKWAYEYFTGNHFGTEIPHGQGMGLLGDLAIAPKHVVLVTDGAPNCNTAADTDSCTSAIEVDGGCCI